MGKNYLLLILSFFTTVLSAQTVNIPDLNFKSVLLESSPTTFVAKDLSGAYFKIDANNDGAIQVTEALNVSWLFITSGITDFTGIQSFTNLSTLQIIGSSATSINLSGLTNLTSVHIYRNSQLSGINLTGLSGLLTLNLRENNFTTIDLSGFGLSALINLYLQNNQLSNVNLNGLTTLKILYAHENQISSIDLTGLTSLTTVWLGDNLLTSFHLNGNFPNLHTLFVENNLLTSFSISNLPALDQLAASNNQLTSITFDSSLLNLKHIFLENNFFSEIDISSLGNVTEFGFNNNPSLTSLNLKNGFDNNYLYFAGVPNLRYICGDENEIPLIQNALAYDNYTGVVVSSYCSFVPGGTFYTIEGNTHFDLNANGCDSNDIIFPNQKFTVTDGTISGAVISNTTGSYSIPIPAGSHIITPVLENPDYFTVSPTSVTTNFPGSANPFIQDFCVTANGIKNDLEVTIIPLNLARPGFNSLYKIIFKNKGNQAANGILNFNFNDALMDLISAIQPITVPE